MVLNNILQVFVYVILSVNVINTSYENTYNLRSYSSFEDENSILSYLKQRREVLPEIVDDVLRAYNNCFTYLRQTPVTLTKLPFIVVDGILFRNLKLVAKDFADSIGGKLVLYPPKCMYYLRNAFPIGSLESRAFHELALYISARNVKQVLSEEMPAVMTRYWYQQMAFIIRTISNTSEEIPESGHGIYNPPKDLLMPDVLIFINQSVPANDSILNTQMSPFNMTRYINIYKMFKNPSVTIVNCTEVNNATIKQVYREVQIALNGKYYLSPQLRFEDERKKKGSYFQDLRSKFEYFNDEKSILSYFQSERENDPSNIDEFLRAYKACFVKNYTTRNFRKKKPFIVIEGSNYRNRKRIINILSRLMGASIEMFPPKCLFYLRKYFKSKTFEKHAFYGLALYAAAHNVKRTLAKGVPVIMNGYWNEQISIILRALYRSPEELPTAGNKVYEFPKDLLLPDMVFFIEGVYNPGVNHNIQLREKQMSSTLNTNFRNPKITVIKLMRNIHATVSHIQKQMQYLLRNANDLANPFDQDIKYNNGRFKSLKSIIGYLESQKVKQPWIVDQILKAYNICIFGKIPATGIRKAPFIVIEGNTYQHREKIAAMLGLRIQGQFLQYPPKCLAYLRRFFISGTLLKQVYFLLSVYTSSFLAGHYLEKGKPVVTNGYWTEQSAFAIAYMYRNRVLPSSKNEIYKQPDDLLTPDMLIYANSSDRRVTVNRVHPSMAAKIFQIYQKFTCPPVTIVNASDGLEKTIFEIKDKMKSLLGNKFNFSVEMSSVPFNNSLNPLLDLLRGEHAILKYFDRIKDDNPISVDQLLEAYRMSFRTFDVPVHLHQKKLFIVIEGNNFRNNEVVAKVLSEKINGQYLQSIPKSMYHLKDLFFRGSTQDCAFSLLSLYVSSFNIKQQLTRGKSVIVNGYWTQHAERVIRRLYRSNELPPPIDSIYSQPTDLLVPDLLIYLNCSSFEKQIVNSTHIPKLLSRILQTYTYFRNPPVTFINCSINDNSTVLKIIKEMENVNEANFNSKKDPGSETNTDEKMYLKLLDEQRIRHPALVSDLLKAYKGCFARKTAYPRYFKRRPFIVIEGSSIFNRKLIGKKLADDLGAEYIGLVPECLYFASKKIPPGSEIKHFFYSLSLYAAANLVRQCLGHGKAVVKNGYWYERSIYIIKQSYEEVMKSKIPLDEVYQQPKDLLMPDLLIYLNYSSNSSWKSSSSPRSIEKKINIYKLFKKQPVLIINSTDNYNESISKILNEMRRVLDKKYNLKHIKYLDPFIANFDLKSISFLNKEMLLAAFEKERVNQPTEVDIFLRAYNMCYSKPENNYYSTRKPFIVIEGNNFKNKEEVAQLLAGKINARYMRTVPKCLYHIKSDFSPGSLLEHFYYLMAVYVTAFDTKNYLVKGISVVKNGYWSERTTIVIKKIFKKHGMLPHPESNIYEPPTDLLVPDIVVYLNYSTADNIHFTNQKDSELTQTIYTNFKLPVKIIDSSISNEHTLQQIQQQIKTLLGNSSELVNPVHSHADKHNNNLYLKHVLFRDEKSILTFIADQRKRQPALIREIIEAYNDCLYSSAVPEHLQNKAPFIVIEGNDYENRFYIGKTLAKMINGQHKYLIPKCLYHLRKMFEKEDLLRHAFYSLSLYASAHEIKVATAKGNGVVKHGYWTEQAAYDIRHVYDKPRSLPAAGSNVYKQPDDLLKPDMVIYLNYSMPNEKWLIKALPPKMLHKTLQIYKMFGNPTVTIIDSSISINDTITQIRKEMNKVFGNNVKFGSCGLDVYANNHAGNYILFEDENSIFTFLHRERKNNQKLVDVIFDNYDACYCRTVIHSHTYNRGPFIVFEGNNYHNRALVSKLISNAIDAKFINILPSCLYKLKISFPNNKADLLRHAYFTLSLYVSASEVKTFTEKEITVIKNGYWTEQNAFVISHMFKRPDELPPSKSDIYKYPDDLLKPDLVIYLNHSTTDEKLLGSSSPSIYFTKTKMIYEKYKEVPMLVIDSSLSVNLTVFQIQEALKEKLGLDYDMMKTITSGAYSRDYVSKYALVKGEQKLLAMLRAEKVYNVRELLNSYSSCFQTDDMPLPAGKRKAFIVIEGKTFPPSETIARRLAYQMEAKFLSIPPQCLYYVKDTLQKYSPIKDAFYSLSLYATAFHIRQFLSKGIPVVMNRYWSERIQLIIRKTNEKFDSLPPLGHDIYKPPDDLLMPDMLVYLEPRFFKNLSQYSAYCTKKIQIYQNLRNPNVTIIDSSGGIQSTIDNIQEKMHTLIGDKCDLSVPNVTEREYFSFKNKAMILSYFEKEMDLQPVKVNHILNAYQNCMYGNASSTMPPGKRKPFIVIEGTDIDKKRLVVEMLEENMNAFKMDFPPLCLFQVRNIFEKSSEQMQAFYALALYVSSFLAREELVNGRLVVTNRYWTQQASYDIARIYRREGVLPPRRSKVYFPPDDVLKPDLLFFLNSTNMQTEKKKKYGVHSKLHKIYKRFHNPRAIIIDASADVQSIYEEIKQNMKNLLGDKYDLKPQRGLILNDSSTNIKNVNSWFQDENSILTFFENERIHEATKVDNLLKAYYDCFYSEDVQLPNTKRKPFIVVEGNNYQNNEEISKKLAERINGKYLPFPSQCLYHLRTTFSRRSIYRHGFFALALYASAFHARQLIVKSSAVVMNGFWYQQAEYIIGKTFSSLHSLPPAGHKVYEPPHDLMMADVLIFSNYSSYDLEHLNNKRPVDSIAKTIEIYKRFKTPKAIIVDSSKGINASLEIIEKRLQASLGSKFSLYISPTKFDLKKVLFKSEKSILDFFEQEWVTDKDIINKVLTTYNDCFYNDEIELSATRVPFIVIEGNNFHFRGLIVRRLSRAMNARMLPFPTECMYSLKTLFAKGSIRKHALFALALYAAANNVKQFLEKEKAVILNGYWFQQVTHVISKIFYKVEDLPPPGDKVYRQPKDLFMPDLLIYLNFTYTDLYITRHGHIAHKTLKIYENLQFPKLSIINSSENIEATIEKVYEEVKRVLGDKYMYDIEPVEEEDY